MTFNIAFIVVFQVVEQPKGCSISFWYHNMFRRQLNVNFPPLLLTQPLLSIGNEEFQFSSSLLVVAVIILLVVASSSILFKGNKKLLNFVQQHCWWLVVVHHVLPPRHSTALVPNSTHETSNIESAPVRAVLLVYVCINMHLEWHHSDHGPTCTVPPIMTHSEYFLEIKKRQTKRDRK